MRVVAVANQKGGVAKTTTCAAVAASLAQDGRRVVTIDLDPQANLGLGLGLDEAELDAAGPSAYEVLTGRTPLALAARPARGAGLERLSVVTAGPRLAQAEGELFGQIGFDEALKRKLRAAAATWDVAVIDCPPSLGPLTINALSAADLVLVPVQCEFFSARGVVKLLDVVELVRERRNPDLAIRLVPTLFDQRNGICRAVLEQLRAELGADVSEVIVGVDTKVREAQARGRPVTTDAPGSRAARAYRDLAREVWSILSARAAPPAPGSTGADEGEASGGQAGGGDRVQQAA